MKLLIYGARGYARTVAELAEDCGHQVAGLIDDADPVALGAVGSFDEAQRTHRDCGVALGIGYNDLPGRWAAWCRVRASGLVTPPLIHPSALVARTARIGPGTVVMAGAIVDQRAHIGEAVVIWPGACARHDTEVGDNCFVSPNATLCGAVRIGANSFIGAAAAIADHCNVPLGATVLMLKRYSWNRRR